ncbi:MAG: lipoate--protein ligase [Bacteroidales bacterium]|jgi:lipoate-protein ligase A|nr:lipoate--protein ligase [Bacteroidales bacterium]
MIYTVDNITDPYWNLAAEEYLFTKFDVPVFRLWRNEKAVIVGRYQNAFAEIDRNFVKEHGVKVVRRMTGGGAVFHDLGNINFTFIESRRTGEDSSAMFRRFTRPILEALRGLGVNAYLEGRNDLLIEGRKFSGNAICVSNGRILQHGTLLFSSSMEDISGSLKTRPEKFMGKAVKSNRSRVTNISNYLSEPMSALDFKEYLRKSISGKYDMTTYEYSDSDLKAIEELRSSKYSTCEWNYGQSPSYGFSRISRFSGGFLEVSFSVSHGKISELKICGDYFFTEPTEKIVASIIGSEYSEESLKRIIDAADINSYFANITGTEFLSMFF